MSILSRIKTIVNASVNDMLDKVEDPEKMINQMIRDMDQGILEIRRETAAAMASSKMIEAKLEKTREELGNLRAGAEKAARKDDDDLALKLLERKRAVEARIGIQEKSLADSNELVLKLKGELTALQDKVQEARTKRETLITKKRAAETNRRMMDSIDRVERAGAGAQRSANQIINGFENFERMEERVERETAQIEAERELRGELQSNDVAAALRELDQEELRAELRNLKNKSKK